MTAVFSLNHYSIPVQERAGRSGVPFTLLPPGNANDWRRWTARQRLTIKRIWHQLNFLRLGAVRIQK